MAVTFEQTGTGAAINALGAISVPYPTTGLLANDVFILVVTVNNLTSAPQSPTGFISSLSTSSSTSNMMIAFRVASGAETGSISVSYTADAAVTKTAIMYRFRGVQSQQTPSVSWLFNNVTNGTGSPANMPACTSGWNSLAVAVIQVAGNKTSSSATGETGGDWLKTATGPDFSTATGNGGLIAIQTATPTRGNPQSITGGTAAIAGAGGNRAYQVVSFSFIANAPSRTNNGGSLGHPFIFSS